MNVLWSQHADKVVSALLNGMLQGSLICIMVWILIRTFRRFNASTRYLIWLSALGLICLLPLAHFLLARTGVGQGVRGFASERSTPVHSPRPSNAPYIFGKTIPDSEPEVLLILEDKAKAQSHAPLPKHDFLLSHALDTSARSETSEMPEAFTELLNEIPSAMLKHTIEPSNQQTKKKAQDVIPFRTFTLKAFWPPFLSLSLLSVILLVAIFKLARLALDLVLCWRLKTESFSSGHDFERFIIRLKFQERTNRRVQVKVHPNIKTPLALGFFHPMILIPQSLVDSMDEEKLSCILRHEWAHIVRYDDWTNLFQRLLEALFFFHPVVALVGRRLDIEREIACDDHVLAEGSQAKEYALMLTQFVNRERDRHLATATAGWNKKHQIKERIDMLLDHHRNTAPRPARMGAGLFTLAILAVAIIALNMSPRLALAQSTGSSQELSDVDELFDKPIHQPRSKSNGSSTRSSQQVTASTPSGDASSLFDSNAQTTRPTLAGDSVPEPLSPLEAQAPVAGIQIKRSNSGTVSELVEPARPAQRASSISRARITRVPSANASVIEVEVDPFADDQLEVQVETHQAHEPHDIFQSIPSLPENVVRHTSGSSALEERIKALENLVHNLMREDVEHHLHEADPYGAEDQVEQAFPGIQNLNAYPTTDPGNPHPTHNHSVENTAQSANPYHSTQREARQVMQRERLEQQREGLVRTEFLNNMQTLQEQKARLEAERQQLSHQIKILEQKVQSLDRKLAQEFGELNVFQRSRDEAIMAK